MKATHAPPNADYFYHADENLRLSEADPYHALIRAVINRAYWDSVGRVGASTHMTQERRCGIMRDALAFFKDGRALHLVECLGCDPALLGALGIGE